MKTRLFNPKSDYEYLEVSEEIDTVHSPIDEICLQVAEACIEHAGTDGRIAMAVLKTGDDQFKRLSVKAMKPGVDVGFGEQKIPIMTSDPEVVGRKLEDFFVSLLETDFTIKM